MEGAGPGREDGHLDGGKGIAVCYWPAITRARSSLRNAEQMEMSCLGQSCKCPHSADHGCGAGKGSPVQVGILAPNPLRTFIFLLMKVLRKCKIPSPVPGWHSVGICHRWPLLCTHSRQGYNYDIVLRAPWALRKHGCVWLRY